MINRLPNKGGLFLISKNFFDDFYYDNLLLLDYQIFHDGFDDINIFLFKHNIEEVVYYITFLILDTSDIIYLKYINDTNEEEKKVVDELCHFAEKKIKSDPKYRILFLTGAKSMIKF
jgi:hypothetical protein